MAYLKLPSRGTYDLNREFTLIRPQHLDGPFHPLQRIRIPSHHHDPSPLTVLLQQALSFNILHVIDEFGAVLMEGRPVHGSPYVCGFLNHVGVVLLCYPVVTLLGRAFQRFLTSVSWADLPRDSID